MQNSVRLALVLCILSGLPMVLFAGAAIAGSLMIARLGALMAMLIGRVRAVAQSVDEQSDHALGVVGVVGGG